MGAYGLPALHVNPPQQGPGPLEQYGQLAQLRAMMGQQQLQQQQIQGATLQNQETQMDLQSRQAFMKAYTEAQGDPDKTMQLAAKYGADPRSTISMQNLFLEQKTKSLQYFMTHGDAAKRDADLMQGAHDAVAAAKPEQRPAVYQQQLQALSKQLTDPTQLSQLPQQYPGDDAFRFIGAMVKSHTQQMDELSKQSEINKNNSQGKEADLNAKFKQMQIDAAKSSGIVPGIPLENQEAQSWLKANPGKSLADFMKYKATLVPSFNFNMQGGTAKYDANDPTVQAVADGRMKIGDVLTYRVPLPVRRQFLAAVQQVNPNFDSRNYDVEKGVMKSFTSGDAAKNITAYNTAIAHAQQLQQAADALDNGDIRGLNKIGNALGYQFGSDKTTNFNVIKNALAGEVSKVFKGGQATDAEIKEVQEPFNSANSPAQLKGAINNAIHLMNSKRDALKQQYQQGMQGKPNFEGNSVAEQHVAGGQARGLTEGQTGTGSDGRKYVVKGGVWVLQQ